MGIKIKLLSSSCLTLILSACGGGGGGGSPQPNNLVETPPEMISVSGGVTKGIVRNGLVDLYAVGADGQVSSSVLTSTVTADDGMFSFDLETVPAIAYVEVYGRSEGGALMQCDLSNCGQATADSIDTNNDGQITFGEWQVVGDDFRLTGYLSGWSAGEPLSINLYTHIVAQTLSEGVDAAALESANQELKETLGLQQLPHEVMPIDVTEEVEDSSVVDNLLMGALLESSADQNLSLAEKVEALADTSSTGDMLAGVSVAQVSAVAIDLSASLSGSAVNELAQTLTELNEETSAAENTLPAESRPLLPPLI